MSRRVVITATALHSPLGSEPGAVFDRVLRGEHGISFRPDWAAIEDLRSHVGAAVPDFDGKAIPRKTRRTMGRVAQLAASAAEEAARRAGLGDEHLHSERTGVIMGSTVGSAEAESSFWGEVNRDNPRGIKGTTFFQCMPHTCAANAALHLGVIGEVFATNSACASSNQAIGLAMDRIRAGRLDIVLAGGAEELHPGGPMLFDALGAATHRTDPDATPTPFQAGRDGIVVGEGAGVLVVEALEHAEARGATVLAEVLGTATRCDAAHMAMAQPDGMERAIRACLADAGLSPDDVDHIDAHATGTRGGDAAEAEALHRVFGDRPTVSSLKGHLGHTLGACGAIEALLAIEAMHRGIAAPTRGLTNPDVAPLNLLQQPREQRMRHVLKTSFAFGGVNSVLLLRLP